MVSTDSFAGAARRAAALVALLAVAAVAAEQVAAAAGGDLRAVADSTVEPSPLSVLHSRLLHNDFTALPELLRRCPNARWTAEAPQVAQAAKALPDPQHYDGAVAALRLLAGLHGQGAEDAVVALQLLPVKVRDALAAQLEKLAANPGPGWSVQPLRAAAMRLLASGDSRDPFLVDLLLRLSPQAAQRVALAEALAAQHQSQAAAYPPSRHFACRSTAWWLPASSSYQTLNSVPSPSSTVDG